MKPIEARGSEVSCVPDEPSGRFSLIGFGGVLLVEGASRPGDSGHYEGDEVVLEKVSYSVAMQLPYQHGNTTLLDRTAPPDPDHPGARLTTGPFRLMSHGHQVASAARGLIMEYLPEAFTAGSNSSA